MSQAEEYKNQIKMLINWEEMQTICDKRTFVVDNRALFIFSVTASGEGSKSFEFLLAARRHSVYLKHTSINTHSGKQANSRVREHLNRSHIHSKCENMPKKEQSCKSLRIGKQSGLFTILVWLPRNLIRFCRGNPCEYKNLH